MPIAVSHRGGAGRIGADQVALDQAGRPVDVDAVGPRFQR